MGKSKRAPANPDKFEEASTWFRARTPVTRPEWDVMSKAARRQAFTVAGTQQLKVVQTVFDEISRSIDKGTPLSEFKKALKEKLGAEFTKANSTTLTTAFVNANQTAYNTGRYYQLQDPAVTDALPYQMFDAVLDDHTCFAAGTPVRMANGSTRAIDQVSTGDFVFSCRGEKREVIATVVTPKRVWGTVTLADGRTLRVTPNHPFLTASGWIPARSLCVGDGLVVEENDLPGLWVGLREEEPDSEVLRHLPASLDRPVAGCLQDVQEGVRSNTSTQAVLQSGVCSSQENLQAMQSAVRVPTSVRSARPIHILFGQLQAFGARPGNTASHTTPSVRTVREDVPCKPAGSAARKEAHALFEGLPEAASPSMRALRQASALPEAAILLDTVRSHGQGGERPGDWRSKGARTARDLVRARSEDWALVGRLSDREQDLPGSGRCLLARRSTNQAEGLSTRLATGGARLLRGENRRGRVQPGSAVRDPRALGLWPVPGNQIAEAATAAIVDIVWELTESAEPAYDIQVANDSGFIANGVVVHNSDICKHCAGTLRRFDDPWWLTHWPPLHHRCRSCVRAITAAMAQRMGGITKELPRPAIHDDWGLAPPLRVGDVWSPDPAKYDGAAFGQYQRKQSRMAENDNARKKQPKE